jgi:hypothetical protein
MQPHPLFPENISGTGNHKKFRTKNLDNYFPEISTHPENKTGHKE